MPTSRARQDAGKWLTDQDMRFEAREWKVQRISWSLWSMIILAGLAGLFGGSSLLNSEIAADAAVQLRFARFLRYQAPHAIEVRVNRISEFSPEPQTFEIWFRQRYLAQMSLENITPAPLSTLIKGEHIVFVFKTQSELPARIVFRLRPVTWGVLRARIGGAEDQGLEFWQAVFP